LKNGLIGSSGRVVLRCDGM